MTDDDAIRALPLPDCKDSRNPNWDLMGGWCLGHQRPLDACWTEGGAIRAAILAEMLSVERVARAIHTGRLDTGEPLCSMWKMPLELCPAAPHSRHAAAIIERLRGEG